MINSAWLRSILFGKNRRILGCNLECFLLDDAAFICFDVWSILSCSVLDTGSDLDVAVGVF